MAYLFSLGFTFIGAVVFAFSRVHRRTRIPQEAVIGIVYAVSAAAAILVMSKATQETEHLKEMLVGNILSVTWPELGKTALLYALVGAFHYVFRERFLLISMDEEEAERRGWNVRFWDFLFYASFGFVVTSSVADRRRAAGLLLPDRALGDGDALLRAARAAARDRLDDGRPGVGRGCAAVVLSRPSHRRDHRRRVRRHAAGGGGGAAAVPWGEPERRTGRRPANGCDRNGTAASDPDRQ